MHVVHAEVGWVEVICGPMFSGKSEELIRRLRRAQIARQALQIFKPRVDDRYAADRIVSHSAVSMDAEQAASSADIAALIRPETRVIGIDEVQFFDKGVVPLAERLASAGVRVIVAGLDQDYLGRPFEPVPSLLAIAEYITKTLAICALCGAPAGRSQRLIGADARVQVGGTGEYEARCRNCHVARIEPRNVSLEITDPS